MHSPDCVEIKTVQNYDLTNGESVTIDLGILLGRSESAAEVNHNDRIHAVSLIRNPLIRNSPEDSWKNRKWNPEPFEPKVKNKK